mmetsp:Transcript_1808/g.4656  ORF Transcript_1808/g.4656 Transcript_1808/m.4656 type:complete len:170 (-) Transcript_1808:664-1173(-)
MTAETGEPHGGLAACCSTPLNVTSNVLPPPPPSRPPITAADEVAAAVAEDETAPPLDPVAAGTGAAPSLAATDTGTTLPAPSEAPEANRPLVVMCGAVAAAMAAAGEGCGGVAGRAAPAIAALLAAAATEALPPLAAAGAGGGGIEADPAWELDREAVGGNPLIDAVGG